MNRFFVPASSLRLLEGELELRGELVHQIRDVLRLGVGEQIIALDNLGTGWRVELVSIERARVCGRVLEREEQRGEPRTRVTLYQALLKGEKFEWVLQKGTEIGVAAFVPLMTRRSVPTRIGEAKQARWRRILTEAAEQAGRACVPDLGEAIELEAALERTRLTGLSACTAAKAESVDIFPYEGEKLVNLREALERRPGRVGLWIGPEGGWDPEEAAQARESSAKVVTLGPRILRAETAGLATAAAIFYALGEMEL